MEKKAIEAENEQRIEKDGDSGGRPEQKKNRDAKLEAKYKEVLQQVVEFGIEHGITSFARLRGEVYREIRERYPLPSHYIYTACRDAAARLESFKKLKRKGRAKGERPEIKKVSIWLDDC